MQKRGRLWMRSMISYKTIQGMYNWVLLWMDLIRSHNSASHSTWPIVLVNYNLPPWMSIQKEHLILSTIVHGKWVHYCLWLFCILEKKVGGLPSVTWSSKVHWTVMFCGFCKAL